MKLALLDWFVVAALMAAVFGAAVHTNRYTKSVADFLAANRCAGRYVIGVAEGIAGLGAVTVVALFEAYYAGGFSFAWWGFLLTVVTIVISMTGWVQYRYRQTRVLTMAELFERRYSKRFRVVAGVVIFTSGTLNFAIFPGVGANFFMHYGGFDSWFIEIGYIRVDLVYAGLMFSLLSLALAMVMLGGQVAVIVTDYIQGAFFNIALCVIALFLLLAIPWVQVAEGVANIPTPDNSLVHPLRSSANKDFNMWFYIIQSFVLLYTFLAWQGQQAYYASAISPHEARMGRVIGSLRDMTQRSLIIVLPVSAYVVLNHGDWQASAALVNAELDSLQNPVLQKQLTTSITMRHLLPVGLAGAFAAMMLAAFVSTHTTYLHSWGSVFVQDIVGPISKMQVSRSRNVRQLRLAIVGVAIFIYLFSLFVPLSGPIFLYFALTGTIWLGGAGAIIIGGLYWRRGNTCGAYGALATGFLVAVSGFALQQVWPARFGSEFPFNSQWMLFFAMVASSIVYVLLSILTGKKRFNLDSLLNHEAGASVPARKNLLHRLSASRDYKAVDRATLYVVSGWSVLWAAVFLLGTAYNLMVDVDESTWIRFWQVYVWFVLLTGILVTIWLLIGGWRDLRSMFNRLAGNSGTASNA